MEDRINCLQQPLHTLCLRPQESRVMPSLIETSRGLSILSFSRRGIVATLLLFATSPTNASTLNRVRQTKTLRCGINRETAEYSTSDDHGGREAFDADLCKAVAIAILGPNARTTLTNY